MTTLSSIFQKALKGHWAVPHFNVSNLEQLRGVCQAAGKLKSPLMIGTSEGERAFIGLGQALALMEAFEKEFHVPLFVNADHTYSVKAAKAAVDAGYPSIHIDLSKKSWRENVAGTKEVVRYAKKKNPRISVEGELGYLVTDSSKVYKRKITIGKETLTNPDEAVRYVKETGVDRFAPAVGNLHGIAANRPKLDYQLVKEIRRKLPGRVAMVLHGGSGNSPAAFSKAVQAGFTNIHISTGLRLAYANTLRKTLKANPDEIAPYKIFSPVVEAVQKEAEKYITTFGSKNKVGSS